MNRPNLVRKSGCQRVRRPKTEKTEYRRQGWVQGPACDIAFKGTSVECYLEVDDRAVWHHRTCSSSFFASWKVTAANVTQIAASR